MKISVIYPIYNQSKFLKASLESILAQTYTDFEVLAVNDGSTDNSLEILKSFTDPRIKVFSYEENKFINHARNVALDNVSGDYVLWIDSDDTVEPNYFEDIIKIFDENKDIDAIKFKSIKFTTEKAFNITDKMDTAFTCSKIVKSELVKDLRYPEIRTQWSELSFNLMLCEKVKKVAYINNNYYHYDNRGISTNKSVDILIDCYQKNMDYLYKCEKTNLSLYDTNREAFKNIHTTSLSLYISKNYGSLMTNYSLYKFLEKNHLYPAINASLSFVEDPIYINVLGFNTTNTINPWLSIVGSDFSWRSKNSNTMEKLTLSKYNKNTRRVAIGPSWEKKVADLYPKFKDNISNFSGIFLREEPNVNLFNEAYNRNATSCIDPVFLNDVDFYKNFIGTRSSSLPKNMVFAYLVRADNNFIKVLEKISAKLHNKIYILPGLKVKKENLKYDRSKIEILSFTNIKDFVYYFSVAKYVITDSFHGECFSLIFNKNFSVIQYKDKWTDRFDNMSKLLKEEHSYIPLEDFDIDKWHERVIDYEKINKILDEKIRNDKKNILDAIYGISEFH